MPSITTPQELHAAFVELPDNVRHWLVSEKVSDIVADMNTRLDYHGDKISAIPWLITRLAVKDLAPKYFMSELRATLVVDENEARAITEEIDKKILRPIERDLSRAGVDLNSLYLGQEAPATIKQESKEAIKQEAGPGAQPAEIKPISPISPISPIGPISPIKEGSPTGPLILHAEKEPLAPATPLPQSTSRIEPPRPAFSLNIPQSKYKKPAAPPPVTVRIETPGEDVGSKKHEVGVGVEAQQQKGNPSTSSGYKDTPPKIMKVVHYSPFYTNIPKGNE
ncbi:MAG: hypothetical protein HYV25_03405 [Candidatus Harrisonbacteria bacterium]|nr:hypothetical protein [Candidatus Harrisonbacteria bacterium]